MRVKARAPINIALLKYWGKQDDVNVIPYNDSLSLSLDAFYTETVIEDSDHFSYTLNGKDVIGSEKKTLESFIKQFTSAPLKIKVTSTNTGPTAAGLASSASAFASLGKALDRYFDCQLSLNELAEKVRKGSGSACRSLLGHFVQWKTTGEIIEYANPFDDLCMVIVLLNKNKKKVTSRVAMKRTVKTSPLYSAWVSHALGTINLFKQAIKNADYEALGKLTETSFLAMHGSMLAANPPVLYMEKSSLNVLDIVKDLRDNHHLVFATMDAGPNVKVLTRKQDLDVLKDALNEAGYKDLVTSGIDKHGAVIVDED